MEWAQVLAIVVLVMLTIVIGVIYNNKRIDDLRADVNRRFDELKVDIREFKVDTDRRFEEAKADVREIRQFLLRLIPVPAPSKENPR